MNVLVVGGTGVISYAVVQEATKRGYEITCINRGRSKNQRLSDSVQVFIADYHDEVTIKKILRGKHYDAVIDVLCYKEKDIEYSVNLFKDVCDQYIFFSSCAVYNKGKGNYVCDENSQLENPVWNYSINKVACEKKLISMAFKFDLNYTIVRPAVTYGNTRIPYGITPPYGYHGTIIQRLLKNKPIILWDKGQAISTITRVEDFAVGLVGLIGNAKAYNQCFNVVGDERHKWKDVIGTLADILNVEPTYINLTKEQLAKEMPLRKGEILGGRGINQLLDNRKIKSVVPEFKTTISLHEGLERTVRFYQSHNYLLGIDYRFDATWDYIVRKYSNSKRNTGFIDYLHNASVYDRFIYYTELHSDKKIVKAIQRLGMKLHSL